MHPDSATQMHILKRSTRSDNSVLGDIVPLTRIRSAIELVPRFGTHADPRLTAENSLEYCTEFWLNKYETKETFWAFNST